jgi:subtilisin family serine protease/flagellar hook assembly protein FlgD
MDDNSTYRGQYARTPAFGRALTRGTRFMKAARLLALGVAVTAATAVTVPAGAAEPGPPGRKAQLLTSGSGLPIESGHVPSSRRHLLAAVSDPGKSLFAVHVAKAADLAATIAAAHAAGATTRHVLPELSLVTFSAPQSRSAGVVALLRARASVVAVEPVRSRRFSLTPNDTQYSKQSGYLSAINAPTAWDTAKGSATVKIAVIDSGIDANHPDLASKLAGTYNAVTGGTAASDVVDAIGHGTFVAGVAAAATNNGVGVAGVGFGSSLLAVKVADEFGDITTDDEAAGIVWAANHDAKVINISLGSIDSDASESSAIRYAQQHGALVVAAAGNETTDAKSYPAAYPGVLAVGATDGPSRADFSNYGPWVSVAAPGYDIFSTLPTAGSEIGNDPAVQAGTSGYGSADGTSFSSPMVAGEAALLLAAAPGVSADIVRKAIVDTAHGFSGQQLGTGQIDVAAALTHLPPTSTPSLTSPTNAAVVTGSATAAVTSGAPSVQFAVDGNNLGTPVAVSGGSAAKPYETWGYPAGSHTVTARDCNAYGCSVGVATATVTVQNPPPTITAPTASDSVHDDVAVTVTTSDAVPLVRLSVDGVPVGAPVAVVNHAATLTWPSAGFSNASHTVSVADCASTGACASSASVTVTLANATPTPDSPSVGQVVTGATSLTGSSTSGGLLFRLDGGVVGFDSSAPYSVPVDFSSRKDSGHSFTVQGCGLTQAVCNGPVSPARSFSSTSLHPRLASQAFPSFSPNGDRRADATSVNYGLLETDSVAWTVRNAAGATVRGPLSLGTQARGGHTVTWNGYSNGGKRAADGAYTLTVAASRQVGHAIVRGQTVATVRVDTVAPVLTALAVSGASFFPYRDGYQDTLLTHLATSEAGSVTMTIRNSHHQIVRTLGGSGRAGTRTFFWNGHNNQNALVPSGTYSYDYTAADAALNSRTAGQRTVVVSTKRLVAKAAARTVTPAETKTDLLRGACSQIYADKNSVGGYVYASDALCQPTTYTDDIAVSLNQLTLIAGVRYAGISLTVNGQRAVAGYDDIGYAAYRTADDTDLVSGTDLSAANTPHALPPASPALLYRGRTLRWVAGTFNGNYYEVRSFTVRYTYYVLA